MSESCTSLECMSRSFEHITKTLRAVSNSHVDHRLIYSPL